MLSVSSYLLRKCALAVTLSGTKTPQSDDWCLCRIRIVASVEVSGVLWMRNLFQRERALFKYAKETRCGHTGKAVVVLRHALWRDTCHSAQRELTRNMLE